jgi:hypothetical protein
MIRYALVCANGDAFEGWFQSIAAYEEQEPALHCPLCGVGAVRRAPMAPAVQRSAPEPSPAAQLAARVREFLRTEAQYVGGRFAQEVRAITAGEAPERALWGEATPAEAKALIEEGAPVAPLPPGFAPPPPETLN